MGANRLLKKLVLCALAILMGACGSVQVKQPSPALKELADEKKVEEAPKLEPSKPVAIVQSTLIPESIPTPAVSKPKLSTPKKIAMPVLQPTRVPVATPVPKLVAAPQDEPEEKAVLEVNVDALPLDIGGEWTLDRRGLICTLRSRELAMEDGQGGTNVSILLTSEVLVFITGSAIDLSYKDTGLFIGEAHQFPLETIEQETNLQFQNRREAILDAMKSEKHLSLSAGFWPTWPVTQAYSVEFPLIHFAGAYTAWQTCHTKLTET